MYTIVSVVIQLSVCNVLTQRYAHCTFPVWGGSVYYISQQNPPFIIYTYMYLYTRCVLSVSPLCVCSISARTSGLSWSTHKSNVTPIGITVIKLEHSVYAFIRLRVTLPTLLRIVRRPSYTEKKSI